LIDESVSNVTVKLGKEISFWIYGLGTIGNNGQGMGRNKDCYFLDTAALYRFKILTSRLGHPKMGLLLGSYSIEPKEILVGNE